MPNILISTGDYSADLHGAALVRELKKLDPAVRVAALGGVKLKETADEFLQDMVALDVSGISQPLKLFFRLKAILDRTVFPRLTRARTDAVVLIDYYGFNIHIARRAKRAGIPVFYFVSPQVWASRAWRIRRLKESVTRMLVLFPFEETLYREQGVPVEFVGHPILESVPAEETLSVLRNANGGKLRLGLMPGSRPRELVRHIPLMLSAHARLRRQFPNMETVLFAVDSITDGTYRSFPGMGSVRLVRSHGIEERMRLSLCLTASGTATLENAVLGLPMVVVYQTSWLTYLVARCFLLIPHVSMPNILAGRELVPELLQNHATPESVAAAAGHLLSHPDELESMRNELIKLKKGLGSPGAYLRAARSILNSL